MASNMDGQPEIAGEPPPAASLAPPLIRPAAEAAPLPAEAPLSPEHLRQLEQANTRAAKLRKAAGVALFNGATIAVFAGGALFFALLSPLFGQIDLTALVMGAGLGFVAFNEFRGRRLLQRFDPRAPRLLGWNQIGLMALILGYCAWMIAQAMLGPNPYAQYMNTYPEMNSILGGMDDLTRRLKLGVYGALAVGTVGFQGLNALYYFRRGPHLRAYLAETPAWVVEVQRRTAHS